MQAPPPPQQQQQQQQQPPPPQVPTPRTPVERKNSSAPRWEPFSLQVREYGESDNSFAASLCNALMGANMALEVVSYAEVLIKVLRWAQEKDDVPTSAVRTYLRYAALPPKTPVVDEQSVGVWRRWHDNLVAFHRSGADRPSRKNASSPSLLDIPRPAAGFEGILPARSGMPSGLLGCAAAPGGDSVDASSLGCRIPEACTRGITMAQMRHILDYALDACEEGSWQDARSGKSVDRRHANFYHVLENVVNPATAGAKCSMAELVSTEPQPPQWCVSHWYGTRISDFIVCIEQFLVDKYVSASASQEPEEFNEQLDAAEQSVTFWVCAFALSQDETVSELRDGVENSPFVRTLLVADGALSIIDRDGIYYERAWCSYEQYKAIESSVTGFEQNVVTALESKRRPAVCLLDGFAMQDVESNMLKGRREGFFPEDLLQLSREALPSRAQASSPSDLESLRQAVQGRQRLMQATLVVHSSQRELVRQTQEDGQESRLEPLLRALQASRVRRLVLNFFGQPTEPRARKLMNALPRTVVDLRFERSHPIVVQGACRLVSRGQLINLELSYCSLGPAEGMAIAQAVTASDCQLRTLNLRDNELGVEGGRALAEAIRLSSTLLDVNLGCVATSSLGRSVVCTEPGLARLASW